MHRGRLQQLRKRRKVPGRRSSFYQVSIGAWFIVQPCSHVPCGVRLSAFQAADVAWVLLWTLAAAGTVLGVDCSLSVYSCFAMLRLAILCYAMACYAVGFDLHMAFGAASIGREDVVRSPLVYRPVVRY